MFGAVSTNLVQRGHGFSFREGEIAESEIFRVKNHWSMEPAHLRNHPHNLFIRKHRHQLSRERQVRTMPIQGFHNGGLHVLQLIG
jgi:hypothetical protein